MVPMLLKCTPEVIKQDLIASRAMTVTGIMYRLWTIFQPGGSSERVSILRQLTEPKVTGSASDLLAGLRRWRRLMSRSIELNLALPDSIILGGVLHRFADALGMLGGTQLSYRVASVRQGLAVNVRPVALSIEQYAEYLQFEAAELSLGVGPKTTEQLDGLRSAGRQYDPFPSSLKETMDASRDWAALGTWSCSCLEKGFAGASL